jgi:hypothetical protein
MTIEAELADGTVLEFPDGTPDGVIKAAVKRTIAGSASSAQSPIQNTQSNPPSFLEQLKKGTIPERYKAGTILYPEEEAQIRRHIQGAMSGPIAGAVQGAASMLGYDKVAEEIAKNQREGSLLGNLMQPEAWLSGGAISGISGAVKSALASGGIGGLYGMLSATPETENQLEQRATSGALGFGLGFGIPAVSSLVRGSVKGVTNTAGAALGNAGAVNNLAADAARNLSGGKDDFILNSIKNRAQYVPGANPTVAEAIAQQNMGMPFQKGGATIRMQKTLSGAPGLEDVLPTSTRAQEEAIKSFTTGVENSLAPVRNSLLRQANKKGVNTTPILQRLRTMMSTPGDREAEMVKSVLPRLESKLLGMKQSSANVVDARDIYSMRKNLAKIIKDFSKESGTWDKKLGASLTREIQLDIDSAIDSALGNNMWSKGYMQPYASKMAGVRLHEARLDAAKEIAKQVKSAGKGAVTAGDVPQIPSVLSRPITIINYGLKKILGDANTPVARELARRMANPDEYAKLLALPRGNPTRELVERVLSVTSGENLNELGSAE